jgi:thioredoxin-like negative regulator of GroEL
VWRRAAAAYLARGYVAEARRLFERALRYAPDSPEATLGLARSLRAAGEDRRALDLLARARALAERRGLEAHALDLELARGLAELAGDRPAAIARAHGVPPGAPEALEARLLEGRWRAELGDAAGASVALDRLRAAVELQLAGGEVPGPESAGTVAGLLVEAAQIEERERGDLLAAQRHLGLALRLLPRDRGVAAEFRRIAAELTRAAPRAEPPPAEAPPSEPPCEAAPTMGAPSEPAAAGEAVEIEDEMLVERLTEKLRADPTDHRTALMLAGALARLGRDLDLLALLSARMDEGDEDARREISPLRREVLMRLAAQAREAGRPSEAELYEMMLSAD